jgi:hypothetical protein
MKLSKETLSQIKNYASINQNLMLKPGKRLATKDASNKIFSSVSITEEFPNPFAIYDVNEFLSVLSLFNDPDIDFTEKYLTIKEGNSALKYFAAAVENMVLPPEKDANLGDVIAQFDLNATILGTILKTAPVLKIQDISLVGDGSTVNIVIADKKNPTSNSYSTSVGTTTQVFKVNVAVENIKMLPGDYVVSISKRGIKLASKTSDLIYYVAIELDSVFE